MKHFYSGMLVTLALVLAIVMGLVALAETTEPEAPQLPAVESPTTPADGTGATDSALQDALNAYNAARQSNRTENLEAELEEYVAAGKLTQEQADLILNYYKEQDALRNGVCPNCGYQFQTNGGFGKGGRGGKGGHGGKGSFGMMNGGNQQSTFDQQQNYGQQYPVQPNGTAFEGDWQVMPGAASLDDVI